MIDLSDYSDFTNRDPRSTNRMYSCPRIKTPEGQVKRRSRSKASSIWSAHTFFTKSVAGIYQAGGATDNARAAAQLRLQKNPLLNRFAKSIEHVDCGPCKVLKFEISLEPTARASTIPTSPPAPLQSPCRDDSNDLSHAWFGRKLLNS
jgi:hypothetical protein